MSDGIIQLTMETGYPWDGHIQLNVHGSKKMQPCTLYLRLPGWTTGAVMENTLYRSFPLPGTAEGPYQLTINGTSYTADNGLAALQRGPVVYCMEEQNCSVPIEQVTAGRFATAAVSFRENVPGGVTVLIGEGVTAVPYFAWANRGAGKMKVWIPE
jgi:uncharacterized protein